MTTKATPAAPVIKDSTPVTHYVNVWLKSCGSVGLGNRCLTLSEARDFPSLKGDDNAKRLCILKVTTIVEVA